MITCCKCNTLNFDDAVFCFQCGNKFEAPAAQEPTQQCSVCGNVYKASSKFCSKCGTPSVNALINSSENTEPQVQAAAPAIEVETPIAPVEIPVQEPKTYVKLVNVQTGATYEAELGEQLTIGKRDCGITISDDKAISGIHCQIYPYESSYVLADAQSTNGTKLNDYLIETPVFIENGSILGIGRQKFTVTFEKK